MGRSPMRACVTAMLCGLIVVLVWGMPAVAQEQPSAESPPIPAGKVLLTDDFSSPTSGWFASDQPVGLQAYENGEYRVVAKVPGGPVRIGSRREVARDFVVEVDARLPSGKEGEAAILGVRFVGAPPGAPGGFMRFQVRPADGRVALGLNTWDGSAWGGRLLAEANDHPAIRRGTTVNRLGMKVHGTSFVAYVNGQEIFSVEDGTFMGGGLVLGVAGPEGADTEARFDNLVVSELTGE